MEFTSFSSTLDLIIHRLVSGCSSLSSLRRFDGVKRFFIDMEWDSSSSDLSGDEEGFLLIERASLAFPVDDLL
ncbi:hypothetical protein L1987_27203 [Smallanthus sonchifolius]|uniref:Uncharacterized protein n=1 Tax=Smallanthus sonchifolius TaxID=185202 RepID=A0ACB9IC35_9ASTR|nr:hypothetical protein L1987_27203 [Smallanthus sonchifolius]